MLSAKDLINRFVSNSEDFYTPANNLQRGLNSYKNGDMKQTKSHLLNAAAADSPLNSQISGNCLLGAISINTDKNKKKSYQ